MVLERIDIHPTRNERGFKLRRVVHCLSEPP